MEQFSYSEGYLKRKGVTPHDVAFVIASTLTREFDLQDSRRSNPRVMLIGFTPDGDLIEVGLEQLRMAIIYSTFASPQAKHIG